MLILVGVTIATTINGDGIIGKARNAATKYKEKDKYESGLPDEISKYIDNTINKGNEIKDFIIEIKGYEGIYTNVEVTKVSTKNNIAGYVFLLDNEVIDVSTNSKYKYLITDKDYHYISAEVIDENGNAKRSNTIKYKNNSSIIQYLYKYGDEYTNITGGWTGNAGQYNGKFSKGSNYMCMGYYGSGASETNLYTNSEIDLSEYDKLYVRYKIDRNSNEDTFYRKLYCATTDTSFSSYLQGEVTDCIDISQLGNTKIHLQNWNVDNYIYEIWVENSNPSGEIINEKSNNIEESKTLNNIELSAKLSKKGELIIGEKSNLDNENISGYAILIDDKVVDISYGTKHEIACNEDIRNKKLEFLILDKAGNYYRYEQKNIENIEKMYLYKYGDEFIDITGGWTGSKGQTYATFSKGSNYMLMGYTSNGGTETNLYTNNEIDLRGYEKLYVHYKITRNYYNSDTLWAKLLCATNDVSFSSYSNGEVTEYIDISDLKNTKIHFQNWDSDHYIYEIWVEP